MGSICCFAVMGCCLRMRGIGVGLCSPFVAGFLKRRCGLRRGGRLGRWLPDIPGQCRPNLLWMSSGVRGIGLVVEGALVPVGDGVN